MTMREQVAKAVQEELARKASVTEERPSIAPVSLGSASYTKMLGKTAS